MTDLGDFLLEPPEGIDPPPDDDEGRQRFTIQAHPPEARDKLASWAFRKIAVIEAEMERITRSAQDERIRIGDWEMASRKPLERDRNYFEGLLTEYLRFIRHERGEDPADPKTKSYKLPTGTISGRAGSESIVVLDEEKFLAWARDAGYHDLIREKYEVDKTAIKKHIAVKDGVSIVLDTGERAPFVEVKRGDEKLSAKPSAVVERG